jgi:hypothetical protein
MASEHVESLRGLVKRQAGSGDCHAIERYNGKSGWPRRSPPPGGVRINCGTILTEI